MKITKQLKEYLENRDFYNTFEIANTIADYKEWKHKDDREISEEIWDLAIRYIKQEKMYLEDEERTWKWLIDEFKTDELQKKLGSLLIEVCNTYRYASEDIFRKQMIDKIYNCRPLSYHEAETVYEYCCFKS